MNQQKDHGFHSNWQRGCQNLGLSGTFGFSLLGSSWLQPELTMATGLSISLRSETQEHSRDRNTGLDWTSGRLHQQEGRKPGRRERSDVCGVRGEEVSGDEGFTAAGWDQPAGSRRQREELARRWRTRTPTESPAERTRARSDGSWCCWGRINTTAEATAAQLSPWRPVRFDVTAVLCDLTDLWGGIVSSCGAPGRLGVHQPQVLQLRQVELWDRLPPKQEGVVLAVWPVHHLWVWGETRDDGEDAEPGLSSINLPEIRPTLPVKPD